MQVDERHPLKWPEGFGRTLIDERKDQRAWKKQMSVYIKAAAVGRVAERSSRS